MFVLICAQVAPQDLQFKKRGLRMVTLALCCPGERGFEVATKLLKLKLVGNLALSWMWRMVALKLCRPILYTFIALTVLGVYLLFVRDNPQVILVQSANTLLPETPKYSEHNGQKSDIFATVTTSNPFLSSEG